MDPQRADVAVLTGVAKAVAEKLHIDETYAEVLPAQKAEAVSALQAKGRVVESPASCPR